jgi:hypothetical protein
LPAWSAVGEGGELAAPAQGGQDAVRVIVGRFSRQLEPTAKRMVSCYRDTIADYRLANDDFLDHDVYPVSLDALRVTVGDLEHGRRGVADEFSGVRAGASRRVHQDVALESFLHAVRLWGKVLWETTLGCTRADVAAERGLLSRSRDGYSSTSTWCQSPPPRGTWKSCRQCGVIVR